MTYTIEIKMDIEEHVPIVVHAKGSDMDSLLADAEYSVDCPDPKTFHNIDNLTQRTYNRIVDLFQLEIAEQTEMRREAREEQEAAK